MGTPNPNAQGARPRVRLAQSDSPAGTLTPRPALSSGASGPQSALPTLTFCSSGTWIFRAFFMIGCGFSSSSEKRCLRGSKVSWPGILDKARSVGSGSKVISTSTVSGSTGLGVSREVRPGGGKEVGHLRVLVWGHGLPQALLPLGCLLLGCGLKPPQGEAKDTETSWNHGPTPWLVDPQDGSFSVSC